MSAAGPRVVVEGQVDGSPVTTVELAHGEAPTAALARGGWRPTAAPAPQ